MILFKSKRGFTLLEILISLAILASAITTLLIIRNNAIKDYTKAIEARRVKTLLELKMAKIVSGIEQRSSGDFSQLEGYEHYRWVANYEQIPETLNKKYTVYLKKITLIVYAEGTPREKGKKLETYMYIGNPEDEIKSK